MDNQQDKLDKFIQHLLEVRPDLYIDKKFTMEDGMLAVWGETEKDKADKEIIYDIFRKWNAHH